MPNRQTAARPTVLRNTCTVAAILGVGLLAGALLGETSLMSLNLPRPSGLRSRASGVASGVNGYLTPADSMGQSRHTFTQPHGISAHHTGL